MKEHRNPTNRIPDKSGVDVAVALCSVYQGHMTPHKWQQVPAAAAHMSPLCPGCKQLFHRSSIYTHDETIEMTIYLDHFTFCDNCDLFSGEINFLCNNFNSSQFTEVWLLFPVIISFHLTRIKLPLSLPTSYTLTS